ncbi:hypothetical protein M7I_7291 [Glarea lozoyensis 74030]|uniref:Uncharacterized protein n=1 Tax=Glarea lozoyensis (strain ATCC 74030 / MF5533) TaxID=1104152 RepID=H0EWW6_GLAL7|nr:hypothetical protein M7I_7291 [Glarea lozoyensis 74030]
MRLYTSFLLLQNIDNFNLVRDIFVSSHYFSLCVRARQSARSAELVTTKTAKKHA